MFVPKQSYATLQIHINANGQFSSISSDGKTSSKKEKETGQESQKKKAQAARVFEA